MKTDSKFKIQELNYTAILESGILNLELGTPEVSKPVKHSLESGILSFGLRNTKRTSGVSNLETGILNLESGICEGG